MMALLGSLLGFGSSFLPEVLSYFKANHHTPLFTGLQRGMVVWGIITLRRVFPSVRRFLVVFMRRKTSDLACLKY